MAESMGRSQNGGVKENVGLKPHKKPTCSAPNGRQTKSATHILKNVAAKGTDISLS